MRCEVCLFNFSLSHLAKCACIIALATLNLSTAVQAVGVKAPGRSLNGGDGGGDGGDAEALGKADTAR